MEPLRGLANRPTVIVDGLEARLVGDAQSQLGIDGLLGNGRMVSVLRSPDGPVQVAPPRVIAAPDVTYLSDPSGNLIGDQQGLWVNRMLRARRTADTRRL